MVGGRLKVSVLKRFIPEVLGGSKDNIFNLLFEFLEGNRINPNRHPLLRYCLKNKPDSILEIGLGDGKNSVLLNKLSCPNRHVIIDIFEEWFDMKKKVGDKWENVARLVQTDGVEIIVGDSRKELPKLSGCFDLIFIDGCHQYEVVKQDWINCKELMKGDTVVFFHDYDHIDGVTECFDEIQEDKYEKKVIEPKFGPASYGVLKKA